MGPKETLEIVYLFLSCVVALKEIFKDSDKTSKR